MNELIQKIHETPFKTVIAVTGGGTEVIGELLKRGNGSKTLIEAIIPYDPESFKIFIKGTPDKFCSAPAARNLAMASLLRAKELSGTFENMIGIGATSSLTKDKERDGRKHSIYIATQTAEKTTNYEIDILNNQNRLEQETLVSQEIIKILAYQCNLIKPKAFCTENETPSGIKFENLVTLKTIFNFSESESHRNLTNLFLGKTCVTSAKFEEIPERHSNYVFPGSFNPIHSQHIEMFKKVRKLTGEYPILEMCLRNVDKPFLDYQTIDERTSGILNSEIGPFVDDIWYTTTPKFVEKAEAFPGKTFVIGFDTLLRLADLKYCGGKQKLYDKEIAKIKANDCRFLVFHRIIDGVCSTKKDFKKLPKNLRKLVTLVSENEFMPVEISSTTERLLRMNPVQQNVLKE